MKKMIYQNVKGTMDYLPREEEIRRNIRRTMEDVFIQYGCKPLETPILNYQELLASKYAGGAEILEEMYTLSDRGKRELALRYDLTIPFAKVVAMNPTLKMPFKRYEIGKVFRDGPIKTGRYREFTQCDVDIVGVPSQMAEAELMMMALNIFDKLKMEVTIQYNNRKLLVGFLRQLNIADQLINRVILIVDKIEKISKEKIKEELRDAGLEQTVIEEIDAFLQKDLIGIIEYYQQLAEKEESIRKGLEEWNELQSYIKKFGLEQYCVFNPFLARGLEIYTGTIYEIFLTDKRIKSSIGSGGRYDNAIGGLIGSKQTYATVGISFGLDVILSALLLDKIDFDDAKLDYYIIPIGRPLEAFLVAKTLRDKGFKVELELGKKKLVKALDKANKEGVKKVIILGDEEVAGNMYKVRDMKTGEEWIVNFEY
ncbi:histidine--tRNA ligase [Niallia sp. Sow4_A1]|uniref:Histidine--tRNA ligase n=1 Tax=Niallia hominis TaxID=3133173 RepID=A0ABV1EW33_9BACI|nr:MULTISPECIES: histidine--tRNA ligase [Bacillaceae]MCM3363235.1 histidine--tRNA ligase [Niallia sp. MER TA 168]REB73314.1 histidine--tRNA ligase [Cutibacterium acnes]